MMKHIFIDLRGLVLEKSDLLSDNSTSFFTQHWKLIGIMVGSLALVGLGVGLSLGLVAGISFWGFGSALTGPLFAGIGLIFGGLVGLMLGVVSAISLEWLNTSATAQEIDLLEECIEKPNLDLDINPSHVLQKQDNKVDIYSRNGLSQLDRALNNDIWGIIAPQLNRRSITSLMRTCSFFAKNNTLAVLRDRNPLLQIATGDDHTLLLTPKGSVWFLGNNVCGQLGLGNGFYNNCFERRSVDDSTNVGEYIVQVAAGAYCTFLLTNQGSLWWSGCVQDGFMDYSKHFQKYAIEDLQKEEYITQVIAGEKHTLLLTNQANLFACGQNIHGQLRPLNTTNRFEKRTIPCLALGEYIVQAVTGSFDTFLLTNHGNLLGGRSIENFKKGLQSNFTNTGFEKYAIDLPIDELIVQIAFGREHLLLLTNKHTLWVCGNNHYADQQGWSYRPKENSSKHFEKCVISGLQINEHITQMEAGHKHSLLLTNQGNLFVCGNNIDGQLGLPDIKSIKHFEKCIIDNLQKNERIVHIKAGALQSLLLTNLGTLLVCGNNRFGQLGLPNKKIIAHFEKCQLESKNPGLQKELLLGEREENSSRCAMQ